MMWQYPDGRYYYDWYNQTPYDTPPTDGEIKAIVVERLRDNIYTKDCKLRVDVKRGVVILSGDVPSTLAKRAAGDDAWDTPGVVDVSNQLMVVPMMDDATMRQASVGGHNSTNARKVEDVMTPEPVCVPAGTPVADAARLMRDDDVGDVIITQDGTIQGILTDRDLVVRVMSEGLPLTTPVGEIASRDLVVLSPSDPLETAVELMRDRAVRRIPVVEGKRPVGIVSLGDLALEKDPTSALADISAAAPNH
jgi:CBS domain-containing protein